MRKTLLVLALAAIMVFAFATAAFADHAPNFYVAWDGAGVNANGPHTDYQLTTEKCAVCHAVHRAAVPGESFGTSWSVPVGSANTEMLLRSTVANACSYCHIDTAVGGVRLYNGNSANFNSTSSPWTNAGFAHGNGCSGCHAVHGARTFQGPIASKNLRYDIKAAVVAGQGAENVFTDPVTSIATTAGIMDEIFLTGALGANPAQVASGSLPMWTGDAITNPIMGTNVLAGLDTKSAQSTAFCTNCHQNYSSASEIVTNIDGDVALFNASYAWADPAYGTYRAKNHPVGPATANFAAAGSTIGTNKTVAWADATYCRSCHDAGVVDAGAGVVENSYPHFTPGYWKFMGAGADAASYVANPNANDYTDGEVPATPGAFVGPKAGNNEDGHCLKCHRSATGVGGQGVGFTY